MAKNEHGLTPQQERFAQEVAKGQSQAAAYRCAYPKSNGWKDVSVHQQASRLASDPNVSARITSLCAKGAEIAELQVADITLEIKRLALSDIAGIMHEDGRVKLPHELDPATRAAVASFKIDEFGRIEYKFWDKNSALERAAKIAGMFKEDNKQKVDGLAELLQGLKGNVIGADPAASMAESEPDDED